MIIGHSQAEKIPLSEKRQSYYIKRQKGAWGYENILEEKAVTCFPNRNSDFVVLLSEVDEPMVVSTSELTNGERVKLTEKD